MRVHASFIRRTSTGSRAPPACAASATCTAPSGWRTVVSAARRRTRLGSAQSQTRRTTARGRPSCAAAAAATRSAASCRLGGFLSQGGRRTCLGSHELNHIVPALACTDDPAPCRGLEDGLRSQLPRADACLVLGQPPPAGTHAASILASLSHHVPRLLLAASRVEGHAFDAQLVGSVDAAASWLSAQIGEAAAGDAAAEGGAAGAAPVGPTSFSPPCTSVFGELAEETRGEGEGEGAPPLRPLAQVCRPGADAPLVISFVRRYVSFSRPRRRSRLRRARRRRAASGASSGGRRRSRERRTWSSTGDGSLAVP